MDDRPARSAHVYQAQGIVSVQAGCSMDEAWALMKKKADEFDESLERIATEVLDHVVRFDS